MQTLKLSDGKRIHTKPDTCGWTGMTHLVSYGMSRFTIQSPYTFRRKKGRTEE